MIIDKILDRYDGDAYDPEDFYKAMMSYEEGTDFKISRALDSGEEEDIQRELCAYIDDGNYNPKIKTFINSVKWLEADDGKDYSKEFDILGESKKSEALVNINDTQDAQTLKSIVKQLEPLGFKFSSEVEQKDSLPTGKPGTTYTFRISKDSIPYEVIVYVSDYRPGKRSATVTLWDDNGHALVSSALETIRKNVLDYFAKKGESKKNEAAYGTVRVDSEDIAIKVQDVSEYPSTSGASLTVEVPKVETWFSSLSEFSDCIDGMAENCNGYPDISRDGSDILVQINAPKDDESGDYEVIVELRCSTEITSTSLEGVVDLLNHD